MHRVVSGLVGVCLWGSLLLWSPKGWAAEAPFALGTRPEKADFQVLDSQGKVVLSGKTPFVGKLSVGVYRLVIQRGGHHDEARTLRVEAGKPVFLEVELMARKTPSGGVNTPPPHVGHSAAPALRIPTTSAPTSAPSSQVGHRAAPAQRLGKAEKPTDPQKLPSENAPKERSLPISPGSPNSPPNRALPPPISPRKIREGAAAATQPAKKEKTKKARPVPWIPLAIAAACGIAGGVFFGLSQGSLDASKDHNRTQVDAYSEFLNAQSHRTTAFSLLIAGGAALAVAGLMYSGILKSRSSTSRSNRDDRYAPITRRKTTWDVPAMAGSSNASYRCQGASRKAACLPLMTTPTRLLSLDSVGGVR